MRLFAFAVSYWTALRARFDSADRGGRDRGDVPGWVMVTLMTAGLVAALAALAGNKLADLFNSAINTVSGSGSGGGTAGG
jgi:hypothetical protein